MGNPLLGPRQADARPRIYLDATERGATWRLTPNGIGKPAPSREAAFAAGMEAVGGRSAVIIWENDQ